MVTVLFRHRTHYYDKMRTAGKVGEGGQSKNVDFSPISPQLLAFLSDLWEQDEKELELFLYPSGNQPDNITV